MSGVMPWNLSRTWRTLKEVASVETARSYEHPQPLRETLREAGLGLEEHHVRTADGYHLTVHRYCTSWQLLSGLILIVCLVGYEL